MADHPCHGDGRLQPSGVPTFRRLVKALTEELAPATVVQAYHWTVPVFRAAADDMVIAENRCRDIRLPAVSKPGVVPLSTETVSALIDAVPDR